MDKLYDPLSMVAQLLREIQPSRLEKSRELERERYRRYRQTDKYKKKLAEQLKNRKLKAKGLRDANTQCITK
jgi:hypothetical protein